MRGKQLYTCASLSTELCKTVFLCFNSFFLFFFFQGDPSAVAQTLDSKIAKDSTMSKSYLDINGYRVTSIGEGFSLPNLRVFSIDVATPTIQLRDDISSWNVGTVDKKNVLSLKQ